MSAYWCELAWLGARGAEAAVLVQTDGPRIETVSAGVDPPPEATRLRGLVLPGLANAHSHAFQRLLRGRTHDGGGSFWSWRKRMYEAAAKLDPERYLALARATYAEMALAGITTVGEFHYLHHGPGGAPYEDPNEIGKALIAAAGDAGIRLTLLDACYLHGGIGEPLSPVQKRFADASAEAWAERVEALADTDDARIAAAIHSVRAVDPDAATRIARWAAERSRPLHAHVSEQPAENEACQNAHGLTPTALLERCGAISERFTAVHAIHLDRDDIDLLGSAGCTVCACPTTERDLADGIAPAAALRAAGAALALGSDSQAVIDPFEEARAVELDERLATGERGVHEPASLLRAASADGHACLGWPEAGVIAEGALADLVSVDLESVRLAGAAPTEAAAAVVFAATAADVRDVICSGRRVVEDGRHVSIDVAAELREAIGELAG